MTLGSVQCGGQRCGHAVYVPNSNCYTTYTCVMVLTCEAMPETVDARLSVSSAPHFGDLSVSHVGEILIGAAASPNKLCSSSLGLLQLGADLSAAPITRQNSLFFLLIVSVIATTLNCPVTVQYASCSPNIWPNTIHQTDSVRI
jgi:hypothetical protein